MRKKHDFVIITAGPKGPPSGPAFWLDFDDPEPTRGAQKSELTLTNEHCTLDFLYFNWWMDGWSHTKLQRKKSE